MRQKIMVFMAVLGGSILYAQTTLPTQGSSQEIATSEEVAALRREVAELKDQLSKIKAEQPAAQLQPIHAEPAPPANSTDPGALAAPIASPLLVPSPLLESGIVTVTEMKVSSDSHHGRDGITVKAHVTIRHLADVPFTFQGVLVRPDGLIHTDVRGKPFAASREIKTGEEEDTDAYSVWIDLSTLFSSQPTDDTCAQVRIMDITGKVVATSDLKTFKRPWK